MLEIFGIFSYINCFSLRKLKQRFFPYGINLNERKSLSAALYLAFEHLFQDFSFFWHRQPPLPSIDEQQDCKAEKNGFKEKKTKKKNPSGKFNLHSIIFFQIAFQKFTYV